jgi:hypothetical protein
LLAVEQYLALAFDAPDLAPFGSGAEGPGCPALAGASGSPNTMDKVLRSLRKIVVDDVSNTVDVDAASRHVCGYQNAIAAFTEAGESLIPLILGAVTVHCDRPKAMRREFAG